MTSINKENFRNPVMLGSVLKGTLLTLVFSITLSAGSGIVYHFSTVTDLTIPWFSAIILAVSTFGGSLVAGREAGRNGLLNGLSVGLLFFLVVWLASGQIFQGQAVLGIYKKLLIVSSAGAVGGIAGVGLS